VIFYQRLQEREHLEARARVQVSGRLVGEQQRRPGDEGARESPPAAAALRKAEPACGARESASPTCSSARAASLRRSRIPTPRYTSGSSTFFNAFVRGAG
jgi:hypothetical protein